MLALTGIVILSDPCACLHFDFYIMKYVKRQINNFSNRELMIHSLVFVGVIPCAFLFVGLFFIPESPRWLVRFTCYRYCSSFLSQLFKLSESGSVYQVLQVNAVYSNFFPTGNGWSPK